MANPEKRLAELGLTLPKPLSTTPGLHLPFAFVNVRGNRVFVSGHPKQSSDGKIEGPYGKVGKDLSTETATIAARDIGLSVLSNLKYEIGDLSRVSGWNRVFGMVNSAPEYKEHHLVINGFSDLIVEVFGKAVGRHARSAIGLAGLPMNFAIEIEAELEID